MEPSSFVLGDNFGKDSIFSNVLTSNKLGLLTFFQIFVKESLILIELDNLKESIIKEAVRMENEENKQNDEIPNSYKDPKITKSLEKIQEITKQIQELNERINN